MLAQLSSVAELGQIQFKSASPLKEALEGILNQLGTLIFDFNLSV